MILEGVVLLRVQDFQESAGRITTPVPGQLVDLIQKKHGIAAARSFHTLYNSSGQGANIGPPVTSDFRIIPYPTQTGSDKGAIHSPGDGFPQTGFSHARRSYQEKIEPLFVFL